MTVNSINRITKINMAVGVYRHLNNIAVGLYGSDGKSWFIESRPVWRIEERIA